MKQITHPEFLEEFPELKRFVKKGRKSKRDTSKTSTSTKN